MQMLTLVMVVVEQHTPRYEMQRKYAWLALFYGVSSAGILAAELSKRTKAGIRLPAFIHRPKLNRNLSVLISDVELVSRPGDGNLLRRSKQDAGPHFG